MDEKNDQFVSTVTSKSVDEVSPTQHGAWILKWSLPHNAFWQVGVFRLVVIIGLLFYLLITISMLLYPGGTKADPHTQGYSFFTNFLSDLGQTVSLSGQSNIPSMVLFIMAMILAGIATALFSLGFTQLFTLTPFTIRFSRLGALCGLIAGLCLIGVGVVPEDLSSWLHNFCIYAALVVFVAAYLLFFLAVVRTEGLAEEDFLGVHRLRDSACSLYHHLCLGHLLWTCPGNPGVGDHPGYGAEDYRLCRSSGPAR